MLGKELPRFIDEARVARQFRRGVMRESQAEAEPLVGGDPLLDRERALLDRRKIIRPLLAGVDVQAVGEVKRGLVLEDHWRGGK